MKIVVVGATSEIAKQCCLFWLEQGEHEFVFSARDTTKLSRLCQDLRIRFPKSLISERIFDHLDPTAIDEFVRTESRSYVDMVLIAHGSLTNQCIASENPEYFWHQLETNAISPMLFAELWSQVLIRQEGGHLAVIGSVAGDRGRAINYAYGAAKSGLETYVAGLQHRTQGTGVFVSFVKPGPTRTPMTEHAHVGPTRLADPRKVARIIVKKLSKGARTIYAPRIWLYIMLVIKLLPFSIFKKIKF